MTKLDVFIQKIDGASYNQRLKVYNYLISITKEQWVKMLLWIISITVINWWMGIIILGKFIFDVATGYASWDIGSIQIIYPTIVTIILGMITILFSRVTKLPSLMILLILNKISFKKIKIFFKKIN